MAAGNVIFAVLAALVAVNFIFAEENPLEVGDFDSDQVEGRKHHKPPSKENKTEKPHDGTVSVLFDASTRELLSSSCNFTQGNNYYLSCTRSIRISSNRKGSALKCSGVLRYSDEENTTLSPDS